MDITIAGSTYRSAPMLAHIGDVQKLYDLARDRRPAARAQLTESIGTILETVDITPRESELVADVMIGLMRQAEIDLRRAVAEKLAVLDHAPLRLVLQMANDEIEVARPVLTQSTVLGEFDLLYIIKSKTAEHWQAIATRAQLSDRVMTVLAETKDFGTALALVENTDITLTEGCMTVLSDVAQDSDVLALPLLRRTEVPQDIATALYQYVGEEVKAFITENYSLNVEKVTQAVDKTVEEFIQPVTPRDFMPDDYMFDAAKEFKRQGMLNIKMMLSTLRRGHIRSFVAQFSVHTGLPIATVGKMMAQPNGQGLAIAAKAFGIEKQDFISIFMLTSKIWNKGRLVEMDEIQKAIEYYNRATPEVARSIIQGQGHH